jgi:hypothetical protein
MPALIYCVASELFTSFVKEDKVGIIKLFFSGCYFGAPVGWPSPRLLRSHPSPMNGRRDMQAEGDSWIDLLCLSYLLTITPLARILLVAAHTLMRVHELPICGRGS